MKQFPKSLVLKFLLPAFLAATIGAFSDVRAQQWGACFAGRDLAGGEAFAAVGAERYNNWYEIMGPDPVDRHESRLPVHG